MTNSIHDLGNKIISCAKWLASLRAIFRRPAYISFSLILILAGLQIINPPFWQDLLFKLFGIMSGSEGTSIISIVFGFFIVISGVFVFSLGLITERRINKTSNLNFENHQQFIYFNLPSASQKLYGREEYLRQLDSAWADNSINVVVINSIGGMGKTSLVSKWATQFNSKNRLKPVRTLAWSFYRSEQMVIEESPIDQFFRFAYKNVVRHKDVAEISYDKISLLCESIRKEKTLIILDGIEVHQFPPGNKIGRFKDERLRVFIQNLALNNNGLCILTTRVKPTDLEAYLNDSVKLIELQKLTDYEGAQFLKQIGVKGNINDLKEATFDFKGHPLSLKLLGNFLVASNDGDIVQQKSIERFVYDEEPDGKHACWVINSYEKWLKESPKGNRELNILYLLSVINRPVILNILVKICSSWPQKYEHNHIISDLKNLSISQWRLAINDLHDFGLLIVNDNNDSSLLSCHPIVIKYFFESLAEKSKNSLSEIDNAFTDIIYGFQLERLKKLFIHSSKNVYSDLITNLDCLLSIKLSSSEYLVDDIIDYIPHAIRIAEAFQTTQISINKYAEGFSNAIKDGINIRLNTKDNADIQIVKGVKSAFDP